jgi:hypothetical protein
VNGYVAAGYCVTFGTIGLYAAWVIRRGKVLSRNLNPRERTWR